MSLGSPCCRGEGVSAAAYLQLPSTPTPARPFHCGGSAGRARGGAEMVAPGAAPAPRCRRALPQDGAGQAPALAVRGQGGPGGRPGRLLGPRGAARAQPSAAGPRRGLRGQRRGPEVGAGAQAGDPARARARAAGRGFASPPLASCTGSAGLHLPRSLQPWEVGGTARVSPRNPAPKRPDSPVCLSPAALGTLWDPRSLLVPLETTLTLVPVVAWGRGQGWRSEAQGGQGGRWTAAQQIGAGLGLLLPRGQRPELVAAAVPVPSESSSPGQGAVPSPLRPLCKGGPSTAPPLP